jgi:BNR repeat protein
MPNHKPHSPMAQSARAIKQHYRPCNLALFVYHRGMKRYARQFLLTLAALAPLAAAQSVPVMPADAPGNTLGLPIVDLAHDNSRQTVVDREQGQYLGHVSTVLLDDGKTIIAVYPKGHGRGPIVMKRSTDGGRTWSDRLPTPDSWATSKEVPTIHRVTDAQGTERLILWSGLYPARLAVSEDDGLTWSELEPAGDWGGIVVMGFVEPLAEPGHYLAMFHDDGRFFTSENQRKNPVVFNLYQTISTDGGLTWSFPKSIWQGSDIHLCEPGIIRSPDGTELAVLLRENAGQKPSQIIFSTDEAKTWSDPVELPLSLTGDRHTLRYANDGRIVATFRDNTRPKNAGSFSRNANIDTLHLPGASPTEGDWVAWVGTYDDLKHQRTGQYRIRLGDNTRGWDTTYPGLEVLPDGTIVATTYGHWTAGESPYILTTRFTLQETDTLAAQSNPHSEPRP